jgi:hypothetical protein
MTLNTLSFSPFSFSENSPKQITGINFNEEVTVEKQKETSRDDCRPSNSEISSTCQANAFSSSGENQ